jgi:hypothetical protein
MSENLLLQVISASEAARLWYLDPSTVKKAIYTRRNGLEARKSGRDWLVTVRSCEKRWGKCPQKIPLE